MKELLLRFLLGGTLVSTFAVLGDLLQPKSFAGLFGAAPSVALATLALTVVSEGKLYAANESRSMIAGALAFLLYTSCISWLLLRYKLPVLTVTLSALSLWLGIALGIWFTFLK